MKKLTAFATLALLLLAPAQAQDAAELSAEDIKEIKAFTDSISPGKEHELLKKMAGRWTTEQTQWMASSDNEPIKIEGTAKGRMVLGGRYLIREYECDFPGIGAYKGMSTSAYDKISGEYIDTWIDTMGTGVFISRGKSTAKDTIEQTGKMVHPMTRAEINVRTVTKVVDRDTHFFTMWSAAGEEKEIKVMEITYKRDKSKPKPKAKDAAKDTKEEKSE